MYMKWAGFITYLSAQRTLKPMDWLRTFRNHSAKCDTLPTLRERMPNKRCTNSCDTTGQHHTQPLAKMQLSSCSTATTRCAFPSYRSQYTTPKFANEMHKLEAKPKRLQGFQDEFKAPQHTSQWQSPVASAPVQDQVKVWPSPIQSRLGTRYPDHSYTWWPSTKKRYQEIQESS